ncbi:MAG: response regulator [Armatimonadetes bacterium]|nr:response regulator [Armatimonadota bacterium]MDW8028820.1 response regulator [Armatimonadota bacterium]
MTKEWTPRVLIVEDEGMVNRFYGYALEQNGFSVHQVMTGEGAIEAALQQTFDVAVIDLRLQGKLDGLTTFRVLKAIIPKLKGIIVTGYGNRQNLIEALKLGIDGWLEKPVTVTDLVEAVRKAIRSERVEIQHHEFQPPPSSDKGALLKLFLRMLMATTVSNVGILWLIDNYNGIVCPEIVVGEKVSPIPSVPYTLSSEWLVELRARMDELMSSPCLIVPIRWQSETLGAVGLCRCKFFSVPYSQSDLNYLERFAEWLAPLLLTWLYPLEVLTNFTTILETLTGLLHGRIEPTEEHHPRRLRLIVQKLGKALGLSPHRLVLLELAATLHDLGKICLPSQILSKPDKLTEEERNLVQKHPVYSEQMLRRLGLPKNLTLWVRWHHERYDGNGYPDQRRAEEIPVEAQILSLAETLDTLLSPRPYKPPLSFDEALECIRQEREKQFSPIVVEALEEIADELRQALQSEVSKWEKVINASA